jgi:hypothetical protein
VRLPHRRQWGLQLDLLEEFRVTKPHTPVVRARKS